MNAAYCPVNPPGHDWNNGLVCRWCSATRTPEEAIVSGLASQRGGNEDSARALLDAYRAEVVADLVDRCAIALANCCSECDAAIAIVRSRGERLLGDAPVPERNRTEEATAAAATATPQPPVCPVCQNPGCCCRCFGKTPRPDCPHGAATPFFQPGHTYRRDPHGRYVDFHITHVDEAPDSSHRCAFGWQQVEGYDTQHSYTATDLTGWTDVTEAGGPNA